MPRHDEGFFSAKDNLRLFWESDVPDHPKAYIGVVHGYLDHAGRYRRVIDELTRQGFAVHALDYRGHGQSDGRRSHCDRFGDYVDDVARFWERVRAAAGSQKAFLLAHSHGALISTHALAQGRLEGAAGVVLSSPFLAFAFTPPFLKVQVSKLVGKVVPWLPVKHRLPPEDLTRDVELQREVDRDPLYNRVTTPRWFVECLEAQRQVMSLAPKIHAPMFVLVGSADRIALPAATRQFFEAAGSTDKKLKEYPGMVHELMNDLGKEEVWRDIAFWISSHL